LVEIIKSLKKTVAFILYPDGSIRFLRNVVKYLAYIHGVTSHKTAMYHINVVFMAMNMEIMVFWNETPCSFAGTFRLLLHRENGDKAFLRNAGTCLSYYTASQHKRQYVVVKFTLEQAMKAQRGSRGIALLLRLNSTLRRGCAVNATRAAALPTGQTRYPFFGGCVGPRGGMDGCGNPAPHRDSIPGPSSPQRVAVSTALSRPTQKTVIFNTHKFSGKQFAFKLFDLCNPINQKCKLIL
jgi:hypothetical protein